MGDTIENAVYLKKGGSAGLPAAGNVALIADGTGAINTMDSAGARSAIGGGFGSDVIVQLPNSIAANVTALELVTALTTNTAGAEVSKFEFNLINAGAPILAARLTPVQLLVPTSTGAPTPALSFLGFVDSGIYMTGTANAPIMNFKIHDFNCLAMDYTSGMTYCNLNNKIGVGADTLRGMSNAGNNLMFFSSDDIQIGVDGALATNATVGFLDLPSCAGAPTGAPASVRSGKVSMVIDSTNFKIYIRFGASWKSTAALA